jgi:hypothetical protein
MVWASASGCARRRVLTDPPAHAEAAVHTSVALVWMRSRYAHADAHAERECAQTTGLAANIDLNKALSLSFGSRLDEQTQDSRGIGR